MKKSVFKLTEEKNLETVASFIKQHLMKQEDMEAQIVKDENEKLMIQARVQGSSYRKFVGMDCTLNIHMTPIGESVLIDFSNGTWFDKCVAGTIAMFVSWPLAITTAIGAYKQGTLPGKVLKAVDEFLK